MADDYYKHYPRDFLDGIVGMTLEEVGAYIILIDHMYMTNRPLKDDDRYIAGILRCDIRTWRKLKDRPSLRAHLTLNEEGLIGQSRFNQERLKRECALNAKSIAGHRGGIVSGEVRKIKALGEAPASSKTNKIRIDKKRIDIFVSAWSAYPRKVGKDKALTAFQAAINRGVAPEAILAGVERYAKSRSGQDPKYTAHMASWLNAGRWADEDEAWIDSKPRTHDDNGYPIAVDAFGAPFECVN